MTKPKSPAKTPQQLALEHWDWLEPLILIQMKLTMRLFQDGFVHGYKHGREDTKHGVRTRTGKRQQRLDSPAT